MDALAERYEAGKLYLQRPVNEILPPSLLLCIIPPLPPLRYIAVSFLLGCLLLLRVWWVLPTRQGRTQQQDPKMISNDKCTVAVFLGSGGHTTELLQLVSALPTERYCRRIYLVSSGDRFSLEKANDLERRLSTSTASPDNPQQSKVIRIPRARKVHQSFLTTPFSLARSIAFCIDHVALRPILGRVLGSSDVEARSDGILADVILMNGPGTCVPIVAAVYLLRVSAHKCQSLVQNCLISNVTDADASLSALLQILGLRSPKLIYIESFARVKSFSLTAKLIRPFVDRFVLQWPRDASNVTPEMRARATSNTVYSGWLV